MFLGPKGCVTFRQHPTLSNRHERQLNWALSFHRDPHHITPIPTWDILQSCDRHYSTHRIATLTPSQPEIAQELKTVLARNEEVKSDIEQAKQFLRGQQQVLEFDIAILGTGQSAKDARKTQMAGIKKELELMEGGTRSIVSWGKAGREQNPRYLEPSSMNTCNPKTWSMGVAKWCILGVTISFSTLAETLEKRPCGPVDITEVW
jgi:hypothetical protein